MTTPEKFLTDFLKDCVQFPDKRPELIAGYARHMEAREESILGKKLAPWRNNQPVKGENLSISINGKGPYIYTIAGVGRNLDGTVYLFLNEIKIQNL